MARPIVLRWLLLGFLVGAMVAGMAFWFWREPTVLSPEAQSVMTEWLDNTCAIREGKQLESALRQFGGQLEAPLIGFFQSGPAPSEVQRVKDAARRDLEHTRALIKSGAATGLPQKDRDALLMASVDQWVRRAEADFVSSQKANALAGLRIIGGSKGGRLLKQIADDTNSEYSEVARQVLDVESPAAKTRN